MRKPRTDSAFARLTAEQADQLYAICQRLPYGRALAEADALFGLDASVSALARWWQRESRRRLRESVRRGITASKAWDVRVDEAVLDERMSKALKEGFFQLLAEGDSAAALDFATLSLQANKGRLNVRKEQRAERQLNLMRDKFEAAEARLDAARQAVADGESNKIDPAEVMARVNQILGRRA